MLENDIICIQVELHPYSAQIRSSFAAYIVQQRLQKMMNGSFPLCDLLDTYKHMKSSDIRDKV
jgi:hypothetical protein